VSRDAVLAAAAELAARVAPRAAEMEDARRLPPDLAAAMVDTGLFKLCVPATNGGGEVDPLTLLDAIESVSVADGSAGWCLMIGATSGLLAGWLPEAAAAEIFDPPSAVAGGVAAPRGRATAVEGGYTVTGRWAFASGSQHSTWLVGGCLLDGPEAGARTAFFPAADVTIHDTWSVAGLRGTGSHDIEVRDLFVPAAHCVRLSEPPVACGPLYRLPFFGLLAAGVAAVSLGIGRASLDAVVELAAAKTATGHRRPLAQRGTVQAEVARATAAVRSARAYLHDAVGRAWAAAVEGVPVSQALRADLRLAATNATMAAADAATAAYTIGGGTSIYSDHPLQRQFRDAHTATQHMIVGPATYELTGRALLGLEVQTAEL
jgi:alkylation response protein AidB-like acyl-CoA dehydrogenase